MTVLILKTVVFVDLAEDKLVILSQVTEHMLFSDIEYETQNNNDKIETLNGIMTNIDTIKSESELVYNKLLTGSKLKDLR